MSSDGGSLSYEVVDGDTVADISARLGVEEWRLLDDQSHFIQPPASDVPWRPLKPGERLTVSQDDAETLLQAGARAFPWVTEESLEQSSREPGSTRDDTTLPPAHRQFTEYFAAPFYDDEADEFAPFGSDEGWDVMVSLARRVAETDESRSFRDLLEEEFGPSVHEDLAVSGQEATRETDPVLIGAAFTVLRITGGLDGDGCALLLRAIRRQIRRYGAAPTLQQMLADTERYARESAPPTA